MYILTFQVAFLLTENENFKFNFFGRWLNFADLGLSGKHFTSFTYSMIIADIAIIALSFVMWIIICQKKYSLVSVYKFSIHQYWCAFWYLFLVFLLRRDSFGIILKEPSTCLVVFTTLFPRVSLRVSQNLIIFS